MISEDDKSRQDQTIFESAELPAPAVKAGWARVLLFLTAAMASLLIVAVIAVAVIGIFDIDPEIVEEYTSDYDERMDEPFLVVAQLVSMLGAFLLVFVFRKYVDRRSFVSLGFQLRSEERRHFLAGTIWGAGIISILFVFCLATGMLEVVSVQFPLKLIAWVTIMLVSVVLQEELVFRGYILNNLQTSMNNYTALLLVSLFFALTHGTNPNTTAIGLINVCLAGLLLGIYYVHRQNLWFPLGLHFAWNFSQGVVLGVPVSGLNIPGLLVVDITGPELITGGEFGFEGSLAVSVLAVAAIVAVHFRYRRNRP
jgi:hypothetical protein